MERTTQSHKLPDNLSVSQRYMLALMVERMKERGEGWTKNIIEAWFPVTRLDEATILGSFVWTQNTTKTKWILKSYAYDIGGGWVTPGDIARDYLALKFPNRKPRISTTQYNEIVKIPRFAPLACRVGQWDGIYLDLKSAYWSILKVIGWDVEYRPGKYIGIGQDVRDFPAEHVKLARNCLVSCGLPGEMRLWTGKDLIFVKRQNKYVNLMLWALVQDVLNGLAHDMCYYAGAVYVHTDGYIVPTDRERDAYNVASSWGLVLGEKARGLATVRGIGDYSIGEVQSKRLETTHPRNHWKIEPHSRNWLRDKFKRLSERRN